MTSGLCEARDRQPTLGIQGVVTAGIYPKTQEI
jgi:hypothetical protein